MLAEVGSFPAGAGKWGHLDLDGFLSEWVQDREHRFGVLPSAPNLCKGMVDCFVANHGTDVVLRGLTRFAGEGRSASRTITATVSKHASRGLRCAR